MLDWRHVLGSCRTIELAEATCGGNFSLVRMVAADGNNGILKTLDKVDGVFAGVALHKALAGIFCCHRRFFLFSLAKVHLFRDVDNFFNKN